MFPVCAVIVFVGSKLENNGATSWVAIPRPIRFLVDSHRDPAADSLNWPLQFDDAAFNAFLAQPSFTSKCP